jgi:hypothetical protein
MILRSESSGYLIIWLEAAIRLTGTVVSCYLKMSLDNIRGVSRLDYSHLESTLQKPNFDKKASRFELREAKSQI